jgi:hypothetical protein
MQNPITAPVEATCPMPSILILLLDMNMAERNAPDAAPNIPPNKVQIIIDKISIASAMTITNLQNEVIASFPI